MQPVHLDASSWFCIVVWVSIRESDTLVWHVSKTKTDFFWRSFSSLFAKTGRIYLLFSNKSLQLIKYTDRDVGFGVGVVLLGECAILAVMMGLQPATFELQNEGQSEFSFCMFHFPTGIALLVYNGIVMVFGIIISALVSKLRLTLYNEARYIGWAVRTLQIVFAHQYTNEHMVRCITLASLSSSSRLFSWCQT